MAMIARSLPREIPLPTEGLNVRKRKEVSAIESSFHHEGRSQLDALIVRMFFTADIPFNVARSTYFKKAFTYTANHNLGGYAPPRHPLLNFLAVTEDGPMFLRAINTEGEVKKNEYIAEKMIAIIEEVGPQNVVQVITDNAANCKAAGLIVEQKYPHIFWTPCIVHTLNLGLKNICAPREIDDEAYEDCHWISEVAADANIIKNFIMNHSMRLSMFNEFS